MGVCQAFSSDVFILCAALVSLAATAGLVVGHAYGRERTIRRYEAQFDGDSDVPEIAATGRRFAAE